jgi:hypothetical protein
VPLEINSRREHFTGEFAKLATPLLKRVYRAPFIVPSLA